MRKTSFVGNSIELFVVLVDWPWDCKRQVFHLNPCPLKQSKELT